MPLANHIQAATCGCKESKEKEGSRGDTTCSSEANGLKTERFEFKRDIYRCFSELLCRWFGFHIQLNFSPVFCNKFHNTDTISKIVVFQQTPWLRCQKYSPISKMLKLSIHVLFCEYNPEDTISCQLQKHMGDLSLSLLKE